MTTAGRLFPPALVGVDTIEVVESADALDITAGAFRAHLPVCRCTDPPTTVYALAEEAGGRTVAARTHLARCRAGSLHERQVDELLSRLVASFGGSRRVEVVRRSA